MVELSLCDSLDEIPSEAFAELSGPETYPFLRREWLMAFEETGCLGAARGWIPRHLVVHRGSELLAFAPAYIKLDSYGEFVFDHAWAEFSELRLGKPYYPKLIVAVPFTPAMGTRILLRNGIAPAERDDVFDLITGALPELADKLGLSSAHVLFPDEGDSEQLRERDWIERSGIQYQFHRGDIACFEGFLATFKSKRRAAIRREARELEQRQINIDVMTGSSLHESDAELAYRLYLTTVDKYYFGRRYLTKEFFRQVMRTMPDGLHFVLAREPSGDVLGGAFNLLGKDALYGRYWGTFADVPFLHFNVCLYQGVRETIVRGLDRFEPGAGGAHKQSRGFHPTRTRSFHYLNDDSLAAAIADFCRREAAAIQEHIGT